jgi:hypothetical protein
MLPKGSKLRLLAIAAIAPLFIATLGANTDPPPRAECQVARDWVSAHRAFLPTTLAGMSAYPMVFRKAAYHELSASRKASLWREHLSSFLRPEGRLTSNQKAIVRGVISKVEVYLDGTRGKQAAVRDGLTPARLRVAFGDSLARSIFATLGPQERRQPESGSAVLSKITGKATPLQAMPYCSCSRGSDFCGGGGHCGVGDCVVVNDGCGLLWCHECDGQCFAGPAT